MDAPRQKFVDREGENYPQNPTVDHQPRWQHMNHAQRKVGTESGRSVPGHFGWGSGGLEFV